ncbi:MAG TPA: FAD-binding and (Fe-S)-binding domain-containing protein [Puia sp.]|uniref:FAD-binding and (Fe-S)-binding domain-containing protein n=1 Tax=Puia sp. TaxID=2045100 RepID=UPI002CB0A1DB|nr:FAD-binding and (Fe-S)-binding domain-containing protein [Puia sp.]HVU98373.1 FAD-binding and (Fe-S)-binding domain-containing protein [Puia sp.]
MSLISDLTTLLPAPRLKTRPIDCHAWSVDAGFYTLIPKAVVFPENENEVRALFQLANKHNTSITFRTAGTSLSGQSVTDGLMADLSRHWKQASIHDDGRSIRVEPGLTGQAVNRLLQPHRRKIGPDPASINSAMMGGILSNNSSGMCCGVKHNSYHTLQSIRFILPDGKGYDTANPEHYTLFEKESTSLATGIRELRQRLIANAGLTAEIRRKYKLKNTVGYSLNAFLDYEHPLDILAHLLIGAEGTLAFIASATLNTIPDKPYKITGLLFFATPRAACDAIPALTASGAEALEFMDRAALRSIEQLPGAPPFLQTLTEDVSCILCEYQAEDAHALDQVFDNAKASLTALPLIHPAEFTKDAHQQAIYWKLRKGMYPSVAAVRAKGTSVMLEDVAVPVEKLGDAIVDLQHLFARHGYTNALVFGHAREGNLHFLVSQSIATAEDIRLFRQFNDDLADLIIQKYRGSLKAEHGTGRQIAPYVRDEWGEEAYAIMQELKKLVDPQDILNPGVILNADKECHLKNLKSLPVVESEVDKCVECGYCEHRCPSREFTLTPRQRIVLRRSLARLKAAGDTAAYKSILKDYQHDGLDTCAVDGLCSLECPVTINTGDLVKRLRKENHSSTARRLSMIIARHFGTVESIVRTGLRMGNAINKLFGAKSMTKITKFMRRALPAFPLWPSQPIAPADIPVAKPNPPDAIYFPCCMNRLMGADSTGGGAAGDALHSVAQKAGITLDTPKSIRTQCCGQAFGSKGFPNAQALAANQLVESLWTETQQGKLPVVLDISSCTQSLRSPASSLTDDNRKHMDKMTILDGPEFALQELIPRLQLTAKKDKIILHPVCSVYKMGSLEKLKQLGAHCATQVEIPASAGCCGMAGDRGFYYPGLIATATKDESREVKARNIPDCYSTSRPCELALSEATGRSYRSIFHLIDDVTPRASSQTPSSAG